MPDRRTGMTPIRNLTVLSAIGVAASFAVASCGSNTHAGTISRPNPPPSPVALASVSDSASGAPASPGTITTVGTGTVTGAPDTLMIGIGVSTTAPHAQAALSQNNDVATKVQQALTRDGVSTKDIQTTGLSLQDAYPQSDGYQAFDEVTATVRSLGNAGSIIDDAIAAAGDAGRLEMVDFSMSSTDPYLASARQSAVSAAKAEAEQLATAAGAHLGALVSITDQQAPSYPQPLGMYATAGGAAGPSAQPVPVQPGSQKVTVSVTTVWALAP
jgi:uncharacterized protein YggE